MASGTSMVNMTRTAGTVRGGGLALVVAAARPRPSLRIDLPVTIISLCSVLYSRYWHAATSLCDNNRAKHAEDTAKMAVGMLAPVLVLSTGRCGSTMVSDILNRHPGILSVSEFFSFVGPRAFVGRRPSGEHMWRLYSRPGRPIRRLKHFGIPGEFLYPLDDPAARFSLDDLPPILAITMPHLTAEYYDLYDECGAVVRAQPRQSPADHHRHFFEWLAGRLGRRVWVERSGGSLLWGSRLLGAFPDARVIHVYRDGRDTALSMSRHPPFRVMLAIRNQLKPLGLDPMNWVGSASGWVVALLDGLAGALVRPERLRLDRVSLPDFAWFWSRMIEMGDDLFGHFPSDRLLNVAFEDVQASPESEIRRIVRFISPELEDDAWLSTVSSIPRKTTSKFPSLGADERAAVAEACRPGLERLGYPIHAY
ncbi:MAG: sulfotransferase [Gemmatimonadetes bacterium]|nr:sulfotransferase [Gemmatimonadota bacterium]